MQSYAWTATSIAAFKAAIRESVSELVPAKDGALLEAIPRGLGFLSEAALLTALKETPELSPRAFDYPAFIERLGELLDEPTAEAVGALLEGVHLGIAISRLPEPRQQGGKYVDIAYDVEARVSGVPADVLESEVVFHLPQFGKDASSEPYRLDSAHDRRVAADYQLYQFAPRGNTRVAKLVAGQWHGGFYVYAREDQIDDVRCVQAAKTALARAIMPALPTGVRCAIFRPDNYEVGRAWRVEVSVPRRVLDYWNGSPFVFELPSFGKWLIQATPEYRYDGLKDGRLVEGVWRGDLYSNGVAEVDNPVRLAQVKRQFIKNVNDTIARSGYRHQV
jgi:hypothetical protein